MVTIAKAAMVTSFILIYLNKDKNTMRINQTFRDKYGGTHCNLELSLDMAKRMDMELNSNKAMDTTIKKMAMASEYTFEFGWDSFLSMYKARAYNKGYAYAKRFYLCYANREASHCLYILVEAATVQKMVPSFGDDINVDINGDPEPF